MLLWHAIFKDKPQDASGCPYRKLYPSWITWVDRVI